MLLPLASASSASGLKNVENDEHPRPIMGTDLGRASLVRPPYGRRGHSEGAIGADVDDSLMFWFWFWIERTQRSARNTKYAGIEITTLSHTCTIADARWDLFQAVNKFESGENEHIMSVMRGRYERRDVAFAGWYRYVRMYVQLRTFSDRPIDHPPAQ